MNRVSASVRRCLPVACVMLSVGAFPAAARVLTWNGANGAAWDTASANWLDADNNPAVWADGDTAVFNGAGGIVKLEYGIYQAEKVIFSGTGNSLLGTGYVRTGEIEVAENVNGAIVSCVLAETGAVKSGAGTLALGACRGPLTVSEGKLIVSGSAFKDADITVASTASLELRGAAGLDGNLLQNYSFESPAVGAGTYVYCSAGHVFDNWIWVGGHAVVQNLAANTAWNDAGAAKDGNQVLIVQREATVEQTVTVPADGFYSIAFSAFLRKNYSNTFIYVLLDGAMAISEDVRVQQMHEKTYGSATFWLTSGTHTLRIVGEGGWDDRSTMVDWISLSPSFTGGFLGFERNAILRGSGAVAIACAGDVALNQNLSTCTVSGGTLAVKTTPASMNAAQTAGDWTTAAFWGGTAPSLDPEVLVNFNLAGLDGVSTIGAGEESVFPYHTITINGNSSLAATLNGTKFQGLVDADKDEVSGFLLNSFGTLTVNAPIVTDSNAIIDSVGMIVAEGGFSGNSPSKRGPGTLSIGADLPANTMLPGSPLEGIVRIPFAPSGNMNLYTIYQRRSGIVFAPTGADLTYTATINLKGSGTDLIGLEGSGKICTLTAPYEANANEIELYVQSADSTLAINQILPLQAGNYVSSVRLLKTGPGTAVINDTVTDGEKTSGNRRGGINNGTIVRNGTLAIVTDDDGVAPGGALGLNPEIPLLLGDYCTTASDTVALQARADVTVARPVTVGGNAGTAAFALSDEASRLTLAGTVTLERSELAFTGNPTGLIGVNAIALADGVAQATLLSDDGPRIGLGEMNAPTVSVVSPNGFSAGLTAPAAITLASLTSGYHATFYFNSEGNSQVQAGSLTLDAQAVELKTDGGSDFSETGTYTLYTYTGSFTGDVSVWTVANASESKSYTFAHDAANKQITLTIAPKAGATDFTWANTGSGLWSVGSNWDTLAEPNAAGVKAIFGVKITDDATVTLDSGKTVGSLLFNNANRYTLAGQALTLSGTEPAITVDAGSHTIAAPLAGDAFTVNMAENASLTLNNTVDQAVTLETGTLALGKDADLKTSLAVKDGTTLSMAGDSAKVANLTAESGAKIQPNGGTLTIASAADTTLAADTLSGSGTLVKTGASTLAVDRIMAFSGAAEIQGGTLSLKESQIKLNASVSEGATLTAKATEATGLMGYYYAVDASTLGSYWSDLRTLENYLAGLTPNDIIPTSAHLNGTFDIAADKWPSPYRPNESRPDYFVAVWRGVLTIPTDGLWDFAAAWDDAFLLAIDGKEVLTGTGNTGNAYRRGSRRLAKGDHDIVISLMEVTGNAYSQVKISGPGLESFPLPLEWLRPALGIKRVNGAGTLALEAGAGLRLDPLDSIDDTLATLTLGTGSYFAELGGLLSLGTANLPSGGVASLRNADLFLNGSGGSATLNLTAGATSVLALNGDWTARGVSGEGTVSIDGGAYVMEFTGDADCGISADKTYTHAVDLPNHSSNSKLPVINGVQFTMDGNYSGFPTSAWNSNSNNVDGNQGNDGNANLSPMASLLWDFCYNLGAMDATIGGLTPGQLYDFRLYYKNFGNNQRWFTMNFVVEGRSVGAIRWNPDGHKRSIIGCRYRAGASGELHIVVSDTMADTPHYYGFTNEVLSEEYAATHTLTLVPAEGEAPALTGALVGNGSVTVNGAGSQILGGKVSVAGGLTVAGGSVELLPGAALQTGVTIGAGA
ncbi:MAG: hypothetical protein J6334_02315 [Kiritimatiellae bacterium]|nr:hypothetical protein [Kiritimatiellia bacterium]